MFLVDDHHLCEREELAKYQPNVNHFGVGGGGQLLHHTGEDGRHHQHVRQVHAYSCLKVELLEKGCGKGDDDEQDGGQIGAHHLTRDLPSQNHCHLDSLLLCISVRHKI